MSPPARPVPFSNEDLSTELGFLEPKPLHNAGVPLVGRGAQPQPPLLRLGLLLHKVGAPRPSAGKLPRFLAKLEPLFVTRVRLHFLPALPGRPHRASLEGDAAEWQIFTLRLLDSTILIDNSEAEKENIRHFMSDFDTRVTLDLGALISNQK